VRRFRRSRGRSSSKTRRRVSWNGVWANGDVDLGSQGNDQQYLIWTKWPAGLVETTSETGIERSGLIQPIEETVVKTKVLLSAVVTPDTGFSPHTATLCFGITAIENQVPAIFDNVVQTGGGPGGPNFNPDPAFDLGEDWLYRLTYGLNFGSGSGSFFASIGPNYREQWESRAMRKLRPGMGLLAVMSMKASLPDQSYVVSFSLDVRHLFKSGEYSTAEGHPNF